MFHELRARLHLSSGRRYRAALLLALLIVGVGALLLGAFSSKPDQAPSSAVQTRRWLSVPRVAGRLTHKNIGLVINTADPYSIAVGEFYAQARELSPEQVLRIELPLRATLTPDEFRAFDRKVANYFDKTVQALALAWTQPYAVNCNSITGALALGYDGELCRHSCSAPQRASPYFNSATSRPYTDLGLRPSMLLAARSIEGAKELIRRGVAADYSLGWRGAPPANAYFVTTPDRTRSVRSVLFPPPGLLPQLGIDVRLVDTDALIDVDHVLLYITGAVRVAHLNRVSWVAGALADHLTSFGGALTNSHGQMSSLAWIASGATASYGTVSEPCSHLQKFPHPQLLLLYYAQGSTAIEAYWKSVAWPQQGVFIGEPLAAPFARR
ncbi:MAG: TIGR03790 family protein [Nitrococcus sp.]|nr:TIGR03790 family protein [Nitrococcus sp.]